MSDVRRDPLEQRWVVIAPERARRPQASSLPPLRPAAASRCPFCPGHEEQTRPEIMTVQDPGRNQWQIRVVPNYYPMLTVEAQGDSQAHGPYDWMPGVGAQEVVIETEDHCREFADLSLDQATELLTVWQCRMRDLMQDRRLRQILVFKNRGEFAGATLEHAHSQVAALPFVPPRHSRRLRGAQDHFQRTKRPLMLDLVRRELEEGSRVVNHQDGMLTWAPYASALRYELMVAPDQHQPFFCEAEPAQLRAAADALRGAIRRLRLGLGDPAYNLMLFAEPNVHAMGWPDGAWRTLQQDFQWHFVVAPRLRPQAGLEWGAEAFVNATPPEAAADHLKRLDVHSWQNAVT